MPAVRGSRRAVLLPFFVTALLNRFRRTCSPMHSIPVDCPFLVVPKPECCSQLVILILAPKIVPQGVSSTRLYSIVFETRPLPASKIVRYFGLWWRLPPRTDVPMEHRCSAAAALRRCAKCRCPYLKHHTYGPTLPPRRTHAARIPYYSLRVSPVLHLPERPTSRDLNVIGHPSQNALPRQGTERVRLYPVEQQY